MQTVRNVYRSLEQEFGTVDTFVDLHNQGLYYTGETADGEPTGEYSTLSISGRSIDDPTAFGDWPEFDYDASTSPSSTPCSSGVNRRTVRSRSTRSTPTCPAPRSAPSACAAARPSCSRPSARPRRQVRKGPDS